MTGMIDIHEQCRDRWRTILPMFDLGTHHLSGRQGPCPICNGGKDRFRFDNKEGRGTWICNVCGAGNGVDLVMKVAGLSFTDACKRIRERLGETTTAPPPKKIDPDRAAAAIKALWDSGAPIEPNNPHDQAARYLAGRGLVGPYPLVLRFCPSCRVSRHPEKRALPAMLALVTAPDGEAVNVHRTFLEDGQKARWIEPGDDTEASPRRMMPGKLPDGSAIRLGDPRNGRLGVAEGIETALAATQRWGVPCWSAINATMLAKCLPPLRLREFYIFGDNDRKFAGQAAAYELARRAATMRDPPQTIVPQIPTRPGTDWADNPEKWKVK